MKKKKNVAKVRNEPKESQPGKELCADALRMLKHQDDIVSITYFNHFAQFNLLIYHVKPSNCQAYRNDSNIFTKIHIFRYS